jgi:hypothetical protein
MGEKSNKKGLIIKAFFERYFLGAGDRNRTGTGVSIRRILSPLRLPVPPPRHDKKYGGGTQNRTGDEGFADLCLTAWLCRHIWSGKRGSNSRPPPWQGDALPLSYFRMNWCLGTELNRRHGDFQSPALPTELPKQMWRPRSDLNRRSSP